MTPRVREILSWYGADSAGTLTNLAARLRRRADMEGRYNVRLDHAPKVGDSRLENAYGKLRHNTGNFAESLAQTQKSARI
jgi:hypothetical protein